jgi:hypothetical protein
MRQAVFSAVLAGLLSFCNNASAQMAEPAPKFTDAKAESLYNADPATYVSSEPYAERWSQVSDRDVVWRKRILRTIDGTESANTLLNTVSNSGLTPALIAAVEAGAFKVYSNQDDRFTQELTPEEFSALASTQRTALSQAATPTPAARYLVKEDWIYVSDNRALVGRIIGIAPLSGSIDATGNAVEKPLFWIYYPEARPWLAAQKFISPEGQVSNLDRWFEGVDLPVRSTRFPNHSGQSDLPP